MPHQAVQTFSTRSANVSDDDALSVIEQEARNVARAFGVGVPDDLAKALVDRVQGRLQGTQPYFGTRSTRQRAQTRDWLRSNFRGNNYAELSQQTGLSERHVRRVLACPD
jgi:Mor family transcriptional regulator